MLAEHGKLGKVSYLSGNTHHWAPHLAGKICKFGSCARGTHSNRIVGLFCDRVQVLFAAEKDLPWLMAGEA